MVLDNSNSCATYILFIAGPLSFLAMVGFGKLSINDSTVRVGILLIFLVLLHLVLELLCLFMLCLVATSGHMDGNFSNNY